MSDFDATTPLSQPGTPEHHRHSAPPPKGGNPWKIVAIVLAILIALGLLFILIWFLFLRGGGGGTPTGSPTQTTTPTQTQTPTQTPSPPPLSSCNTDNSSVAFGSPDGTAGKTTVPIVFTNTGTADCTLEGFPTVEFVGDGNGTQIGAAAANDTSQPVQLVTLAPGASASAVLSITTAGNVCEPVDTDGFRVIPPGSGDAFFVEESGYQACDDATIELMTVGPITG